LKPYEAIRPLLEPNTQLLWGLASPLVYTGLHPATNGFVWGNVNRIGVFDRQEPGSASWLRLLRAYSVGHVVSAWPLPSRAGPAVFEGEGMYIHRITNALPRAYVATRARSAHSDAEAMDLMLRPEFVEGTDVLVHGTVPHAFSAAPSEDPQGAAPRAPSVEMTSNLQSRITLRVDAPTGGVLVLTDSYAPIWRATVDGAAATVHRANVGQRAVFLPAGTHEVDMRIHWPRMEAGVVVALIAAAVLAGWGLVDAKWRSRRSARDAPPG
jgi:hypothetical protein